MDHYIQPVSTFKNWATVAFIVITNSFGNLLLAIGVKKLPAFSQASLVVYSAALLTNPWILAGIALLAMWMFTQLAMLSWSDLSYVVPVTAIGYAVTALLGVFVLGERISLMRWTGIAVISCGVFLVAQTAPKTAQTRAPRG